MEQKTMVDMLRELRRKLVGSRECESPPFPTDIEMLDQCIKLASLPVEGALVIGDKAVPLSVVVEMLRDLKDQTMSIAVEQSIDRIAAKHGITP